MTTAEIEKKCTKCGESKNLSEFTKDKRREFGRTTVCKSCTNTNWVPRKSRELTDLTQEKAMELLSYNHESGEVRWKVSFKNGVTAGDVAGAPDGYGYISISVCGKPYKAHRLAWLIVHGVWPEFIDHIDHDRANNKLENLREVSRLENQRNMSLHNKSKTGVTGVHARSDRPGWFSTYIGHGKDRKYLGNFTSIEAAVAARKAAEAQMGYHANHGT